MPHIRHTAVLYDTTGEVAGQVTAYTEVPREDDEWPREAFVTWAEDMHAEWEDATLYTNWEEVN